MLARYFFCLNPGKLRVNDDTGRHRMFCVDSDSNLPISCPGIDCALDDPPCMDPNPYELMVSVPDEAIGDFYAYARREMDLQEFDAKLNAYAASGALAIRTPPARTSYLPAMRIHEAWIAAATLVVLGAAMSAFFLRR